MKLAEINAGKAIKMLMTKNDVTREQLSYDLGISLQTASSLRKNKLISGRNLKTVCDYFKITASYFFKLGEE